MRVAEGRGLEPLTLAGSQLSKLLPRPAGRLPQSVVIEQTGGVGHIEQQVVTFIAKHGNQSLVERRCNPLSFVASRCVHALLQDFPCLVIGRRVLVGLASNGIRESPERPTNLIAGHLVARPIIVLMLPKSLRATIFGKVRQRDRAVA
jgi:hypothetical protein